MGAVTLTIASLLQGIGAARYIARLPDDLVGIGLFLATFLLIVFAAIGFYTQWAKEKVKELPKL